MNITIAGHSHVTGAEHILLQGTKEMSGAESAEVRTTYGYGGSIGYVQVAIEPKSMLTEMRLQAKVSQPDCQNLRLVVCIRKTILPSGSSLNADAPDRIAYFQFDLESGKENLIDEVIPFGKEYVDTLYIYLAAPYSSGSGSGSGSYYGSGSGSGIDLGYTFTPVRLFSLSFENIPVGCDGVQIRSLDDRLVSNTDNRVITYPILFLGREPVREDAKGYKEVLIFQDRATTLRVSPQPIVLNEENEYSMNAVIESNGHWILYDYDKTKLHCKLDSGLPITGGAGNDFLRITLNPHFTIYGLYDLVLLFATDTSDDPYIVPVVLDYAVPLSVNENTRKITIDFDGGHRCEELRIVRDRYWKVVGFPEGHLVVGVMEGVENVITTLCLRDDYSELGVKRFSFIVQSGIKRVIVEINVTIDREFNIHKDYVVESEKVLKHLESRLTVRFINGIIGQVSPSGGTVKSQGWVGQFVTIIVFPVILLPLIRP